jgi:hypothetical protein
MAPIGSLPGATRPKQIIEQTFNVFCGPQGTMDMMGFVKFCESSKKVPASDADTIFSTVVQNARNGMNLSEFKAALELCVNSSKAAAICADTRCLSDFSEVCGRQGQISMPIKPGRQGSTRRKSCLENHSLNVPVGLKPKCSSTFRWSPIDVADTINGGLDSSATRRTIRWCPADVEES